MADNHSVVAADRIDRIDQAGYTDLIAHTDRTGRTDSIAHIDRTVRTDSIAHIDRTDHFGRIDCTDHIGIDCFGHREYTAAAIDSVAADKVEPTDRIGWFAVLRKSLSIQNRLQMSLPPKPCSIQYPAPLLRSHGPPHLTVNPYSLHRAFPLVLADLDQNRYHSLE